MSQAVKIDPFNAAVKKLLASAHVPLLTNRNAVDKIPLLREQCIHTTKQALVLAPSDMQLQRQLTRLESGSDMSEQAEQEEDKEEEEGVEEVRRRKKTTLICQHKKFGVCNIEQSLPTLFILGFQKCGTSSLHDWLVSSSIEMIPAAPAVHIATQNSKEVHFFNRDPKTSDEKSLAYYASHFHQTPLPTQNSMYVDGTPDYIWQHAGALISAYGGVSSSLFQSLRFVIIVQPPEKRLVSWWNHFKSQGWIPDLLASFGSDINQFVSHDLKELEDLDCNFGNKNCDLYAHRHQNWGRLSAVGGGMYSYWIKQWLDSGVDPSQIYIVFLSTIHQKQRQMESLSNQEDNLFKFLKVKKTRSLAFPSKNRHSHTDVLSTDISTTLKQFYAPWNCHLKDLIVKLNVAHGVFPEWIQHCKDIN